MAVYIKDYIKNGEYGSAWATDIINGATRQAIYNIIQTVIGQLEYKGLWDASVGTYPSEPKLGWYYVVSVAGEVDGIQYDVGDWIIWNGSFWDKLTGKADMLPIGTILMYDGVGIANITTRSVQIGDDGGDTFRMNGWYVCNGLASTPNLLNKFIRGEASSGNTGGSDDAIIVEHRHDVKISTTSTGASPVIILDESTNQTGTTQTEYEGVSGVGKNIPSYYSVIYIIKKG